MLKPRVFVAIWMTLNIASCDNGGPVVERPVTNAPVDSVLEYGPYTTDTLIESDGLRDGEDYAGATLYFPTDGLPPYSSIVIVPGYDTPESSIRGWGPFYASHGIVAMTIGTNFPSNDFPEQRAIALLDAIETLREENTRSDSPLNQQLNINSFAVSGWSMGGGGAQLAAKIDPSLKAVIALCPWLNETSLIRSELDHPVPLLVFSGQLDYVAPPEVHANIHFDYTPATTDKLLYEVSQGNHRVANGPGGGNGEVGLVAIAWLKVYLEEDDSYKPILYDIPQSASFYSHNLAD